MQQADKQSYPHRRAFIIIDRAGILVGEEKTDLSHFEILLTAGFSKKKANEIIKNSPRGYFKDGNLVFYQGDFEPLTIENIELARKYTDDFVRLFGIDPNIKIFRSLRQQAIATSYKPIHTGTEEKL